MKKALKPVAFLLVLICLLMVTSYLSLIHIFLGFVFGMTSFLKATFAPTITSFCFSPFYSVGDIHGNFWSLLIAFGPRILLGYLSGLLYTVFKKAKKNNFIVESLIAIGMTLLHTLMVMGLIWLFFCLLYTSFLFLPLQGNPFLWRNIKVLMIELLMRQN